jgi:hypothetical protein
VTARAEGKESAVIEIDVRYEVDSDDPTMDEGRPMLTWGRHPVHGNGWCLWYLDDPTSDTAGVEEYFIPGDLTEVDAAVRSARNHLEGNGKG